jgi:hypothetical protein
LPASVSRLPWGVRSGRRTPRRFSRRWIWRLSDGCARCSSAAALALVRAATAALALVRAATAAHTDRRRHNLVNIVLGAADGGTAVARAYLLLTSAAGETPSVVTTGLYTFTLRRAGGGWRIATLVLDMDG